MRQHVERQSRHHKHGRTHDEAEVKPVDQTPTPQTLTEEMDEILDAIDELLEENAEEFVNAYVQKGGQ